MRIPVEQLIDGVVATLREEVLPDLSTRYARGQLFAAVDVLQNLRDRVEERAEQVTGECDGIAAHLDRASSLLAEAGDVATARRLAELREEALAAPAPERREALQRALGAAFPLLRAAGGPAAGSARRVLGEHLAGQAVREVLVLKPSLLREISEG